VRVGECSFVRGELSGFTAIRQGPSWSHLVRRTGNPISIFGAAFMSAKGDLYGPTRLIHAVIAL
jgi:hypothetical protein